MERSMKLDKITLGTCYYPEHWPEEMWEEDLQRMLASGIEVIRIAEFRLEQDRTQGGGIHL